MPRWLSIRPRLRYNEEQWHHDHHGRQHAGAEDEEQPVVLPRDLEAGETVGGQGAHGHGQERADHADEHAVPQPVGVGGRPQDLLAAVVDDALVPGRIGVLLRGRVADDGEGDHGIEMRGGAILTGGLVDRVHELALAAIGPGQGREGVEDVAGHPFGGQARQHVLVDLVPGGPQLGAPGEHLHQPGELGGEDDLRRHRHRVVERLDRRRGDPVDGDQHDEGHHQDGCDQQPVGKPASGRDDRCHYRSFALLRYLM